MNQMLRMTVAATLAFALLGCDPQDRRVGLWLVGDVAETFPDDWSFIDDHREIAIQVATPYFIAHSVTIWCVQVDGRLFIAAGNAATKNWPGWVDDDPNVRLKIGEDVYEARLTDLVEPEAIQPVQEAYALKYDLGGGSGDSGGTRYWRVQARGS